MPQNDFSYFEEVSFKTDYFKMSRAVTTRFEVKYHILRNYFKTSNLNVLSLFWKNLFSKLVFDYFTGHLS